MRDKNGLIQGMKIRLDDADKPNRKYRWLSSRHLPNGTRSYSWVHVTGDTTKKRAFLTEGPLKGDVASFLAHNALFVCIGGVNALHGLKDTLVDLGVTQVVEAICVNYLRSLEATKLSITGHMYFVPRTHMDKVDVFEDFITLLGGFNRKDTPLMVNSFYIIDDEKQRSKMTEEFYAVVKKEIAEYQERADYFIKSGSQSPAVMERWVLKIRALEEKKKHYEGVLRRELDGLDDEFATLKFLSQELQVRAQSIRFQKVA